MISMTKSVGRNTKLSEEEVKNVIKMYKENINPMGNISFSDIHRYANELHEQGVVSSSTSDSFWRKEGRLGRVEVEKANAVFSETVSIAKGKEVVIPNVVDLVNKKYKDKDELLKHLIFMEKHLHESLGREKKLELKLLELEDSFQKTRDDLKESELKNDKLQSLVYRLFRVLSDSHNNETIQRTEYAMNTVFDSPIDFLNHEPKIEQEDNKILSINSNQNNAKSTFSTKFRK